MNRLEKRLTYTSIALSVLSAICIGRSVLNPFEGLAYNGGTLNSIVSETPEHARWQLWNDRFGLVGLLLIIVAAVLQVAALRVSSGESHPTPHGG